MERFFHVTLVHEKNGMRENIPYHVDEVKGDDRCQIRKRKS